MPRFKNKKEYEEFMRAKYASMLAALTLQPEFMEESGAISTHEGKKENGTKNPPIHSSPTQEES